MASGATLGAVVGGFRLDELLARGGMGVVYRATQVSLERRVAVKVIAPELSADPGFRERFVREARLAASLEHPHLLPVYEAGEEDGVVFLAMRLVEGMSLAELLEREGRLERPRAVALVAQVAGALELAHDAGLVHRDVKPANVLVTQMRGVDHAYLCDFGLSRRIAGGTALTRPEGFVGTAAYAAPEQIRGEHVDGRADVYALGCVLFECLTGRRPFEADDELPLMWAHMHEPPLLPGELDPSLAGFDYIVARALAKEPDERASLDNFRQLTLGVANAVGSSSGTLTPPATGHLPVSATSFVGRDSELAEVVARLEQGARLLTLTGPGGSGKTRLALEAAGRLVPKYGDGVYWVGLAALRDPTLVTESISQRLSAKAGLAEHIGERELLLLLDNIEQVIDAAPELSGLLRECPNVTLLVTSRELLRVNGEVEYEVPPLANPEAVALFCERAHVEPSDEVRELCARLDNLPLAVELAAARTKVLTPKQILERISERLDLLKGGRDADPRQQTLRATIQWSHDLLTPKEQRLFRALSVFAGGCTLEAAEQVADADLDTLQSLVEKSLLRFTNERYWMLETIREYAVDRLAGVGHDVGVRERHAAFYSGMARAFQGDDIETWRRALRELDRDRDNLGAAVRWKLRSGSDATSVELVLGLARAWVHGGRLKELEGWLEELVDGNELSETQLARSLGQLGYVRTLLGKHGPARSALRASSEIYRGLDDDYELARSLQRLGYASLVDEEPDRSVDYLVEATELYERCGREQLAVEAKGMSAIAMAQTGRREEAKQLVDECVTWARRRGDELDWATALGNHSEVLYELEDYEGARASALEALHHARDVGSGLMVTQTLMAFAFADAAGGDVERAVRLFGSLDEERGDWRLAASRAQEREYARLLAGTRATLGDRLFEQAWLSGRGLTLEAVVDDLLNDLS